MGESQRPDVEFTKRKTGFEKVDERGRQPLVKDRKGSFLREQPGFIRAAGEARGRRVWVCGDWSRMKMFGREGSRPTQGAVECSYKDGVVMVVLVRVDCCEAKQKNEVLFVH